jgi:putative transposase
MSPASLPRMTAPRQVLPGATYLVTRRCAQRQFLLRPSDSTNATFLYLLAVAARRHGVQVHVFCVLSNHFHLVLTDPHARLPAFHQFLDAMVARASNAALGRWESFWAPNSYSAVRLVAPGDILDKAAYVLANPVAAGLVRTGRQWPGLWSEPERVGGDAFVARRPKGFFDEKGSLPEMATLELAPPPGFASAEEFRVGLAAALAEREEQAVRDAPGGFLGVDRILSQEPAGRPTSAEPRRGLNPRVGARDKWKRIEALGQLVAFVRSYRLAWAARRSGQSGVTFPFGTYLLRILHGVPCAAAG